MEFLEKIRLEEAQGHIQIYEDTGLGFQEETSFFVDNMVVKSGRDLQLTLTVEAGVRQVRIDPAFVDCMVRIKELRWNDVDLPWTGKTSVLTSNGTGLDDTGSFVFPTNDPNLVISLEGLPQEEVNTLEFGMERIFVGREMAQDMENAAKRRLRL